MNRREFFKLAALGIEALAAHELDLDKLLWVPGQKKIFVPANNVSLSDIVSVELERMIPKIQALFERDDYFYSILQKQNTIIASRQMRVPLLTGQE
jgi:hypothetical protein